METVDLIELIPAFPCRKLIAAEFQELTSLPIGNVYIGGHVWLEATIREGNVDVKRAPATKSPLEMKKGAEKYPLKPP